MKSLIILLISAFLLTGCGGGAAKLFSKFFAKNVTKTYASTNKSFINPSDFMRSPSLIRCGINKINQKSLGIKDKNCNQTN